MDNSPVPHRIQSVRIGAQVGCPFRIHSCKTSPCHDFTGDGMVPLQLPVTLSGACREGIGGHWFPAREFWRLTPHRPRDRCPAGTTPFPTSRSCPETGQEVDSVFTGLFSRTEISIECTTEAFRIQSIVGITTTRATQKARTEHLGRDQTSASTSSMIN